MLICLSDFKISKDTADHIVFPSSLAIFCLVDSQCPPKIGFGRYKNVLSSVFIDPSRSSEGPGQIKQRADSAPVFRHDFKDFFGKETEDRRPKAENRRPKAKGRRPKAKGRKPKALITP